jgi:F420-dependent oxidoreductase-like protein
MKISTSLNYVSGFRESARGVVELEQAGLDVVWFGEGYGLDAPSQMGYVAALTKRVQIGSGILSIYSRTPTMLAMTAAGIDMMSEGRVILGLGTSGPQVVEGFHGVAFDSPLRRTREIIDICRQVWAREKPLTYDGTCYHIPVPEGQGTGLGKPLRIIAHLVRPRIPIWLGALGEKNVALTAEVADGWLPTLFLPDRARAVWGAALAEGTAKRDPALGPLQISAGGALAIGDSREILELRDLGREDMARVVGGFGARTRNFYNALVRRYGYEKEAQEIQELYLSGRRSQAAAAVPDELLKLTSLIGPRGWVAERIAAYKEAGVTHLQVAPIPTGDQSAADLIGEVKALAE